MAYTTIDDPAIYFNTVLYTGDGTSSRNITGVGFQPDYVWLKQRNATRNHPVTDSVRGANKQIYINLTSVESTDSGTVTGFVSDGFTVGSDNQANQDSGTFVSWNWKKSATAGFDIVTYTGNATARTISHSLSAVPKWYVVKNRSNIHDWRNYHVGLTATHQIFFGPNTNAKDDSSTAWNDTEPTSSVFSVGTAGGTNQNTDSMIAYLWSEVKGYSKFGSYTGNGNADGVFVYTGFRPAWLLFRNTGASESWLLFDVKRNTYNGIDGATIRPDSSAAEVSSSSNKLDFLSNGFKWRSTDAGHNASGGSYIYMAFAESSFVNSKGVPTNAR